ncbi:MAG: hypothetical protein ACTTJ7_07985 [Treponema sp.]
MKRIQQKSVWALFCALAVSMLLGACDSPNTPTPNPGNGQQGQQGQNGGSSGGGTSSSGAVAGGGSYSSTKAPLTPEGKALPGTGPQEEQKDEGHEDKKVKKYITIVNVSAAVNHYAPMAAPYVEGVKLDVEVADTASPADIQTALKTKVEEHMKTLKGNHAGKMYKLYKAADGKSGEVKDDADYGDGAEASNKIYIGERNKEDHVYITIKKVTGVDASQATHYKVPTGLDESKFCKEHSNQIAASNNGKIDFTDPNKKADVIAALKATLKKAEETGKTNSQKVEIGAAATKYMYFKEAEGKTLLDFTGVAADDVLVDGAVIYIAEYQ